MPPRKRGTRFLTTGELATLAELSLTTVIRACESGQLKHHKLPGSTHRRIERTEAERWLRAAGFPLPTEN